jgi:hypothetical protein
MSEIVGESTLFSSHHDDYPLVLSVVWWMVTILPKEPTMSILMANYMKLLVASSATSLNKCTSDYMASHPK